MSFGYPVTLDLNGRRAVVVGAEAVRQGKAEALAAAGAHVDVLGEDKWTPEHLDGAFVCVAHSADEAVREAIYREGKRRGVLMNVMDDVARCDFAAPAVVRRGDLTIAVSTGGRSPALARRLREGLDETFGPEWSKAPEILGEVREETRSLFPDMRARASAWSQALDLDELRALLCGGRAQEAKARLRARLLEQSCA